MIIILKKLPKHTLSRDLDEHVAPELKRGFPFKSGHIVKVEILSLRNKSTDEHEFHGLVHAEPENLCRRAIQMLKSKRFKNNLLIVKEFFERDMSNDRRNDQGIVPAEIMEKRIGDRRRGNQLEVVPSTVITFKAVNKSRKLI